MPRAMNKHGYTGVRKRTDGRAKPYYARVTFAGQYLYTKSHETAAAAAEEFRKYANKGASHGEEGEGRTKG